MWNRTVYDVDGTSRKGHIVDDTFFVFKNNGWKVLLVNSDFTITKHFPKISSKKEIEDFVSFLFNLDVNWKGKTVEEILNGHDILDVYNEIKEFFV